MIELPTHPKCRWQDLYVNTTHRGFEVSWIHYVKPPKNAAVLIPVRLETFATREEADVACAELKVRMRVFQALSNVD